MPVFSHTYPSGPHLSGPARLSRFGPVIRVRIQALDDAAGGPAALGDSGPPFQEGLALIDTGAARSAVDEGVIRKLGAAPVGVAVTGTPVGSHSFDVFPAALGFADLGLTLVFDRVRGVRIAPQGIIAILGRDILSRTVLVYDGISGHVVLGR